MYRLEEALVGILGKFPTYMRPPYSSCEGECPQTMADLGYHICYFDLDTDDYNQLDNIQVAKNNVANAVAEGHAHYLSIAHDIHEVTVKELLPYMLETFKSKGYRSMLTLTLMFGLWVLTLITVVTIGECLGDPVSNWYRP